MKLIGNTSLFEILILNISNPHSADEWDKKWIKIELNIKLNGFLSNQFIEVLEDDILSFYKSIEESLKDFSKPVIFRTLEESIFLEGKIDVSGQIHWHGFNIYPIGNGNKLLFRFDTELAQLETLLIQLKKELNNLVL